MDEYPLLADAIKTNDPVAIGLYVLMETHMPDAEFHWHTLPKRYGDLATRNNALLMLEEVGVVYRTEQGSYRLVDV